MDESVKLNYDDITIVPEEISDIRSRSECNPLDEDGFLPIFAAPMSSVVSSENAGDFNRAGIRAVIPRTLPLEDRLNIVSRRSGANFVAFSLNEAYENFYCKREDFGAHITPMKICIDLANGHMTELIEVVQKIKEVWGKDILVMTGNIANPETYRDYEKVGVDYVRISIGSGSVCTTSSCVGVHYPPFSLLKEIYEIKKEIGGKCKIVADGGIKEFRDIQKALLYADYVMIGGLFNKAIESAGKTTYGKRYWNIRGYKILRPFTTLFTYGKEIPRGKLKEAYKLFREGKLTVWKWHWGMSTRKAQEDINKANGEKEKQTKTAEGKSIFQKVEYDLSGWAENETDFLRSAMSYTGSRTLEEYKDKKWVRITQIRYNK